MNNNTSLELPYINVDRDLYLNLTIVYLIVAILHKTKRGALVLSLYKLQQFYFLVSRPTFLNAVLYGTENKTIPLSKLESFSVASLSTNIDNLHIGDKVKQLILLLVDKNKIEVKYKSKDGFVLKPLAEEENIGSFRDDAFLSRIITFIEHMKPLQSLSPNKLDEYINDALREFDV